MATPRLIDITHAHTASRGRHVQIALDEDTFAALQAAVEVAYDDPESVPADFADAGAALWEAFACGRADDPGNHPDAGRPPGTSGSWGEA